MGANYGAVQGSNSGGGMSGRGGTSQGERRSRTQVLARDTNG